ncbi:peamaclein-like [Salvia miltiorrhiza]|uniref:peamaclein-like n=1 Tax=Salvia miltiorrhiza TaxID=226208 RepID=UPI0025AD6F77|nr:peamaclein-like [Salvia miltiorrhiza]
MKILIFTLFLLSSSFLVDAVAPPLAPVPDAGSCDAMCNARCAKAGIYKRCFRYCGMCCNKCKCVPSGTYGNKSECPCYRDMLNAKGQSKCP